MLWTVLLVFGASWITVQAQTWPGVYRMNSACSTSTCCCLVNDLIVTRPSASLLAMNTSVAGVCYGQAYFAGEAAYPSGYSFTLSVSIITLNVILSSDSNNLTVANPMMPSCNGMGVRSTAGVSSTARVSSTAASARVTSTRSTAAHRSLDITLLSSIILFGCILNI